MSLLDEYMENCVMIDKTTASDGRGGFDYVFVDGAEFQAAIILDSSIQAKIAEQQGVTGIYTVTTQKSINLQYHDIFKRSSDSKVFRVTSDGDDSNPPVSATLNMRQVSAEEYTLPSTVPESFGG